MEPAEEDASNHLGALRVLEIGDQAALAFCGLQFARWGAQVFVAEPFVGSLPNYSPLRDGISTSWIYLTANKTIVKEDIGNLAQTADIVISTVSLEELRKHAIEPGPNTIFHEILPFTRGGVFQYMSGESLLLEALSGFLSVNGEDEREPLRMPGNLAAYYTGVSACVATLAALWNRLNTGSVEHIESSQLDALTTVVPFVRSQYTGAPEKRYGGPGTGVRLHPIGEGRVSGNLADPAIWAAVLDALDIDKNDVPVDLRQVEGRRDLKRLNGFLRARSAGKDSTEVFKHVMNSGAPRFGLYQDVNELQRNEQVRALKFFSKVDHAELGSLNFPGYPAKVSGLSLPNFRFVENTTKRKWSKRRIEIASLPKVATPLSGVRIVDFTQAWIGPFASMMLADLGAEVIKVESHHRVDVWRNWRGRLPPERLLNPDAHPFNVSPNFNSTNRGKKEIAIDLSKADGIATVKDLIGTADVVMSNFTPRVMRKFGLDYESLKQINDTIVSVSWSGYGEVGPYGKFKANGATIEALSGWDSLFGYEDGEPLVMGIYQADAFCGMQMVAHTLLALLNRNLTEQSQDVRGSMLETAMSYIGDEILACQIDSEPKRLGNRHPEYVPHGVFSSRDPGKYVAIVCKSDDEWQRLSQVLGLATNAYIRLAERIQHVQAIEELIGEWTRARSQEEIVCTLQGSSIPVTPVLNTLEILENQEFIRRSWFIEQFHPDIGNIQYGGFPWHFSESQLQARLPPPRLGEHTREVLQSIGYDNERIDELFSSDVVGEVLSK